jgi:chitodextrinase
VGVVGYQVFIGTTPLITVPGTSHTVKGMTEGATYIFKVRALDAAGFYADSDPLPVTTTKPDITPPSKPTNLRATTITYTSATLQWDAASDNVGVVGYQVFIGTTSLITVPGTSHTVNGMAEGGTYIFKVRALDAAGFYADSDPLSVTTTRPDITPPSKPENLIARYSTSSTARLQWDAASDNVGVVHYEIFVNGNFSHTAFDTIAIASGLAGSTEYLFSVRAIDAASNAGEFAHFLHHHLGSDLTPPSPPVNLRAFEITSNAARLSWSPSTNNVAVTGYEIWHLQERIDTVPDLQYLVTNLNASTSYTLRVYAVDSAGYRSLPTSVDVTTLVSNGPTNLTFERLANTVGALQWNPPVDSSGVTGYQLSRDRKIVGELPETYHMFGNLTAGVTHLFEVRAIRNGQYSDAVHISG